MYTLYNILIWKFYSSQLICLRTLSRQSFPLLKIKSSKCELLKLNSKFRDPGRNPPCLGLVWSRIAIDGGCRGPCNHLVSWAHIINRRHRLPLVYMHIHLYIKYFSVAFELKLITGISLYIHIYALRNSIIQPIMLFCYSGGCGRLSSMAWKRPFMCLCSGKRKWCTAFIWFDSFPGNMILAWLIWSFLISPHDLDSTRCCFWESHLPISISVCFFFFFLTIRKFV